jgi:pyroglutamyl-peptidase
MKVLVTGFGRFLSNEENPTKEILKLLPKSIHGNEIITVELPVIYDECFDYLKPIIESNNPDIILMLGLAGGRKAITLERLAVNLKDAVGPDNIGYTPHDESIVKEGKEAYFSTLPLRKIEARLQEKNIPVALSNSAGLYVCNNIMYHVLHYVDQNNLDVVSGFVHLPYMDEQKREKDAFSLPLVVMLEAVIDIIKIILV